MPFIANNLEGQHEKIEKKEYSSKYNLLILFVYRY